MNINPEHRVVLEKIVVAFGNRNIASNWIIAGGVAQNINGLDIETKDIDILTDTPTAFLMHEALRDWIVTPMSESSNAIFSSAFGQYLIGTVPIEIAGDLKIQREVEYHLSIDSFVIKSSKQISVGSAIVNVEPLEESLIADFVLGRFSRVDKILEVLRERGVNWEYIEKRVYNSSNPGLLRRRLYELFKCNN